MESSKQSQLLKVDDVVEVEKTEQKVVVEEEWKLVIKQGKKVTKPKLGEKKMELEKEDQVEEQGEQGEQDKQEQGEKSDTESEYDFGSEDEYESAKEGDEEEEDKENEENHSDEHVELVHWRVNFRSRHRVPSDHITVDATSPVEEPSSDPFKQFSKGPDGEILASNFQFRHDLKESTYKNKYVLRLDSYKMTFSERDDSILIQREMDATVHLGTSNNTLFRNRNMAMEELRKLVGMKLRVWRSLFVSNRSQQMGEMDLSKCVNTIVAENLTIVNDSYQNVVEIIKLHRPELKKLTLICCEEYSGIMELEQIRKVPLLKLEGPSGITNEQLVEINATNFEITSNAINGEGINAFLKALTTRDIPEGFYARVRCVGSWENENFLEGLEHFKYANEGEFTKVNKWLPISIYECTMVSLPTNKPNEKLAVVFNTFYFECYKEGKRPQLINHDIIELD